MKVILILASLLNFGCASYQAGRYAEVVSGEHPNNTPITGKLDRTLSTDHYAVIHFNFGNNSDQWLRVKKVRLDFQDKKLNKVINLVIGKDISTWAESISHKIAIDQWNRDIIIGSIAIAGAVVGGNSGSSDLAKAGAAVYSGAYGVLVANQMIDQMNNLGRSNLFPRTHLYQSFSVPAGLFTKRWVLLQINRKEVPDHIYFNVEYLDGSKAKYKVKLFHVPKRRKV